MDFLEALFQMMHRLEGSNGVSGFDSLWQTLFNLQALSSHYSDASKHTRSSEYFRSVVAFGFDKLSIYLDRLVLEPTPSPHPIATALHPRLRMLWLKSHWKYYPAWYRKADVSVRSVFRQYIDFEVEHETDEPSLHRQRGVKS